jgi:hypothetical protein
MFRINSPKVISNSVGGEVIVINLDSGCYYSLNKSAGALWGAITGGADIEDLKMDFTKKVKCREAVFDAFIDNLIDEELIIACNNCKRKASKLDLNENDPLPVIEKFSDMQELLILDPIHEVGEGGWPYKDQDPR